MHFEGSWKPNLLNASGNGRYLFSIFHMKMEILQGIRRSQISFMDPRLTCVLHIMSHTEEIEKFPEDIIVQTRLPSWKFRSFEKWSIVVWMESIRLHTLENVCLARVEPTEPYLDCIKLAHKKQEFWNLHRSLQLNDICTSLKLHKPIPSSAVG